MRVHDNSSDFQAHMCAWRCGDMLHTEGAEHAPPQPPSMLGGPPPSRFAAYAPIRRTTAPARLCIAAMLLASLLLIPGAAHADPRMNPPQRYVACPDELPVRRAKPAPTSQHDEDDLLPMLTRKPSIGRAAPRQEIDIVHWHPIPNAPPRAQPPEPPLILADSSALDFYCVGFERGKNGILHVLAAPPGTRYRGRSDWLAINITAAGIFDQRAAIPWIKRQLTRPIPSAAQGYVKWRRRYASLAAMRSLAEMGVRDAAAGKAARTFVQALETQSPTMWKRSLESFRRLAPRKAQRYAIERLRRGRQGGSSDALVSVAEELLSIPSDEAVAALKQADRPLNKVRGDIERSANCRLLAMRMRMGDEPLRRELVPELGQGLRTNRGSTCFSYIFEATFPHDRPDSIDSYILRRKYALMVKWLAHLQRLEREGQANADWAAAKGRLQAALAKLSSTPRISGGRGHRDYVSSDHGRVLLMRKALGESVSEAELQRAIEPGDRRGLARWIMAKDGLTLGVRGAADRAAAALRWGIDHHARRIYPKLEYRSGHTLEEQGRLVEALARHGDPRFVLGLLQQSVQPYSVTLAQLARRRPPQACKLVTEAARHARREQVERAFWALALYGPACERDFVKLARDGTQPPYVVSTALELLAMMRSPKLPRLLTALPKLRKDHRARIQLIFKAPDEGPPPTPPKR